MGKEGNVRDLLEEEIKSEFEALKAMDPGTEKHSDTVDTLVKLYKLHVEETENDRALMERSDRDITDEREWKLKSAQYHEDVRNRYLRLAVETAGIVLPLVFYGVWMKRGFKFEETGTYTSTTFRGLFNRFRPSK